MKNTIKGFIAGLLVGVLGLVTVFAAGGIISAEFNENKIVFDGNELELSTDKMLSVIKDGEDGAINYIPLSVLELMGYSVESDGITNAININYPDVILSDGTNLSQFIKDKGVDISKGIDAVFEGTTWRQVINDSGFDIDALYANGSLTTMKDSLALLKVFNIEDEVLAILIADDCMSYFEGKDALLGEAWEAVFGK